MTRQCTIREPSVQNKSHHLNGHPDGQQSTRVRGLTLLHRRSLDDPLADTTEDCE